MISKEADYTYKRVEINDKVFKCYDCKTAAVTLHEIYFCSYGIFIVLEEVKKDIHKTYQYLREIFKTPYIYIYVPERGLYDHNSDEFKNKFENGEENAYFETWLDNILYDANEKYTNEELKKFEERLRFTDATIRGSYVDNEGNVFFRRGTKFRPVSEIDADKLYYICLFFGMLGGHRFTMKKYISGLIYLLSFGLFGVGWMFDLFSIYFGYQTDRKKRLILPSSEAKVNKLLFLPVGILINTIYISFILTLFTDINVFIR